jgi:8-oxo-dGTP diphosphatase
MSYLSDKDYNFIYSNSPRICVDLLIKKDGKILLTKRDIEPFKGYWHTPGGRIKFRETIEYAIKRIAKVEINCDDIKIGKLLGVVELLDEYQQGNHRHSITMFYEVFTKCEGDYFDILPENTIPQHKKFIEEL